MSDLTLQSISELRDGFAKKSFSALEVTEAYIKRIEKRSSLNAFLTVVADKAISEARQADQELAKGGSANKPLLGVPVAIKDVLLTKGVRTTCASKMLDNFVPPYSATAFQKLCDAGAIMLGKTNMDEFAMGASNENSAYGAVRNPWDESRVPGGSSGGSAAAVAARLAPIALGSDTGGSIRQPASLCSIVGIKPTYGRVSRWGLVAFASSLDQIGPFARNVRDAAIVTKVIAGHDRRDSTSMELAVPDYEAVLGRSVKGLRIGVPKEYFAEGINAEVEKSVRQAISELTRLGAQVVEISLPHTPLALAVYYIIAPAEASSNLARYDGVRYGHRASKAKDLMDLYCQTRAEGFGREVKRRIMIGSYVLSSGYYDAYYNQAQKVRALVAQDFKNAFAQHCDVIACPASPTTAFKIGEKSADPLAMYLADIFTVHVNLVGLPGIVVPCGFDSQKLPIGLQLIGKPFDEETLFQTAYAYEQATAWHKELPLEGK